MDSPAPLALPSRPYRQQDVHRPATAPSHHQPPRRRRRPSLWDLRVPPYFNGVPLHPAAASAAAAAAAVASGARPKETGAFYSPGPDDVTFPPQPGDLGLLVGINVDALKTLLSSSARTTSAALASNHPAAAPSAMATAAAVAGGTGARLQQTASEGAPNTFDMPGIAMPSAVQPAASGAPGDAAAQATRHARRLYVGNLPPDTTELQIGDFFSRALVASRGSESADDPVISVYINLDKRFAFIETRTMREAAAGLELDGVKFRHMLLRVRRPNDFLGNAAIGLVRPPDAFNPGVLGIVSTQVGDGPNKMFIGGIPYSLTEDQVKALLQTYGVLSAFNLIKEPTTGLSKGFAFFEYTDGSVVEAACEALHGMVVGEKTLTVRRATHAGAGAASGMATFASGLGRPNPVLGASPLQVSALTRVSTRVVELTNVAELEELDDEREFYDIRQDIEEEGNKFGKVEEVLLPRRSDNGNTAIAAGRAFIRYATLENAESAQITLGGRKFGNRAISTAFFDEKRFTARHF